MLATGLLVMHVSVYLFYTYLFSLSWRRGLLYFFFFPFLMSFLFLLFSFLSETGDVSLFYTITAVWIGMFVYFFLLSFILSLILGLGRLGGVSFGIYVKRKIGVMVVVIVVLFSGYSIWNAFDIDIVSHELSLSSFPESWEGRKIAHISDIHLGSVFSDRYLERVLKEIKDQNVYALFITGDIFDGTSHNMEKLVSPLESFSLEGGVYVVSGNHEQYAGYQRAIEALSFDTISIIDDRVVWQDGVAIGGLEYGSDRDVRAVFADSFSLSDPSIVLFHAPYMSVMEGVEEWGSDLLLLGHSHRGQLFPFNYITALIYQGFDYGLHPFSNGYLYTTSGVGGWGPPFRSGSDAEIVIFTLRVK